MNTGARIQAAIELLDRIEAPPKGEEALPADAVLNTYFRSRRYIGAKDRRAIGDAVFDVLRKRSHIDWTLVAEAGLPPETRFRALWSFAVAGADTRDLVAACDGAKHHPPALSEEEARRVHIIAMAQANPPTLAEQASIPAWLAPEIERQFGDPRSGGDAWAEMMMFTQPAATDLRVNTLKATRDEAAAALAAAKYETAPTPHSPVGLRLAGRANIVGTAAYRDGLIEIQDESSQLVALLVGAKPAMRVLDLCAGAGGKALALAAAMGNRGSILACDDSAKRLARLTPRLARSGARIVETRVLSGAKAKAKEALGKFDRVLVDAPCSGSGTWRRHPDAKWRLTPAMLEAYRAAQAALLHEAAQHVRPNGQLVYAVCSILPSEGTAQIEAFRAAHKGWRVVAADKAWRDAIGSKAPFDGPFMLLTPRRHGTDGFFTAILAPP